MLVTFNSKTRGGKNQHRHENQIDDPSQKSVQNNNNRSLSQPSSPSQTTSFGASETRKKKPSSGCITCKIRKKRCNGGRPVCDDCKRLRKHCVWITESMDAKEVKEIRKRVREEEEMSKTVRGHSRKKSESPRNGSSNNDIMPTVIGTASYNETARRHIGETYDGGYTKLPNSKAQSRQSKPQKHDEEEFSSLDTENFGSDLSYYTQNANKPNEQPQVENAEITDFSFTPFINNDFNDSNSNQLLFHPFKSNYLNNLFQPLSPNTLTLLGSHETLSSLNNQSSNGNSNGNNSFNSNDSSKFNGNGNGNFNGNGNSDGNNNSNDNHNNVFQFSNLFETNIRPDQPVTFDDELNILEIPVNQGIPEVNSEFYQNSSSNIPIVQETSPFPPDVVLNEVGVKLFNYYKNHLSSIVSIVPKQSNYYKKIFLPMAAVNKGTLYAILAWSGYHLGGEYIAEGDHYMELALEFLQMQSQRQSPQDGVFVDNDENEATLQKLASLLIMCAAEICKGDVKKWPILLQWCSSIITRRGGLDAFITTDKQSNWIISNFIYHDILASSLNERSTHFPIEDYNKFLKRNKFFDPLQGILKPVFHLMSEVSKMSFDRVNDLEQIKDLENRIDNCDPDEGDLSNFNNDERKVQLKLFKTFKLTSTLYLRQSLLRINSSSLETQILTNQLLENLANVLNSSVESSLCFPMFIAGVNCVNENHRMIIMVHFDQLIKRYNFRNLERIKFLVKTIWERNDNGERFIDWFKIVKDLNWDVSFA